MPLNIFQVIKCCPLTLHIMYFLVIFNCLICPLTPGSLIQVPLIIQCLPPFFLTSTPSAVDFTINLPNGSSIPISHIGTIQFSDTFVLTNVLCVPSFSFNLIFFSKLTSSLHCCFFFLSQHCFIQDLTQWRTIGLGSRHDNLYILQHPVYHKSFISIVSPPVFLIFDNSVDLWHHH